MARQITAAVASLPRIVRFVGTSDGGPCDGAPSAICPHCGSGGRYVHTFICEDGSTRGAMSGCIKLFPVHPIAAADMALRERERDLRDRFGKAAKLNSWDQRSREAIDAYYSGSADESATMARLRIEAQAKASYRSSRRRRW